MIIGLLNFYNDLGYAIRDGIKMPVIPSLESKIEMKKFQYLTFLRLFHFTCCTYTCLSSHQFFGLMHIKVNFYVSGLACTIIKKIVYLVYSNFSGFPVENAYFFSWFYLKRNDTILQ